MSEFLEFLQDVPVVGILRDIPQGSESLCAETAAKCGLKAIEVTMNTNSAAEIISALKSAAKPFGIRVGAGTVRNMRDLENAISAGAEFIVSPNTVSEVIRKCAEENIPSIPGALSPTEVQAAYEAGATCVKIFPANCVGGPSYIKALRGPFRDIPLLACGGVSKENAGDYLRSGANLVAFGASIFKPDFMRANDWETIGKNLSEFLRAVKDR
ncbi:bifunctional 4-hydroxy-2-oxoglutarate aldolase/2-dehydro-3-deoxy-phosphogluconate aldolase [uncultured Fibrobacter sp.]|uniref:bifunctional 4-hydroxy-2-oxoglutarate aldolase/2-dehydro-3-deoxy-phosphogluconate aldolase n=1 Tax=uncultured Fibrobacter sp. TaxID=261512 RepID=UPI0025954B2E|nr:bifunctional 4-hydroxy-2-oxoglutarate aldolase/2-dehydro-3-deoxy-phosphogluconate aldolase [uncultured Fibrobacter sp.]